MLWNYGSSFRLALPVLLFFVPTASAQMDLPFTVGIVEANGNLVPVATFDGAGWSSPWPVDLALDETTPSWPHLPEEWNRGGGSLRNWTLWFENPGPSSENSQLPWEWVTRLSPGRTALTANGFVESKPLCSKNLALATDAGDLRSSLIQRKNSCPDPKRGIATTAESPPGLVERLDLEGEDSRRIAARVQDIFNVLESQELDRVARMYGTVEGQLRYTGQWLDAGRRNEIPLRAKAAFRIREADAAIYYVEIVRDYRSASTSAVTCPGYSYLRTWVLDNDTDLVWFDQDFGMFDCDMKGASNDTPLVLWRDTTGVHLLVRRLGWESEDYLILTIDNGTVSERTYMSFRR